MSEVFDNIKNEIIDFRDEQDKKRVLAAELIAQRIEEDRVMLENSGVRPIFEEIRDSGLVKLRAKKPSSFGWVKKLVGNNETELDYVPAVIVDSRIYLSLRFDQRRDGCSEVRIAAIRGQLNIAHGYNRVDYTPIAEGGLADAIIEGLKNPLRVRVGF